MNPSEIQRLFTTAHFIQHIGLKLVNVGEVTRIASIGYADP